METGIVQPEKNIKDLAKKFGFNSLFSLKTRDQIEKDIDAAKKSGDEIALMDALVALKNRNAYDKAENEMKTIGASVTEQTQDEGSLVPELINHFVKKLKVELSSEKGKEIEEEIADSFEFEDRDDTRAKFTADGDDYELITSEERAEELAVEDVVNLLDEMGVGFLNKDIINTKEYMYVSDTDKRIMANEDADVLVDGRDDEELVDMADMKDEYEAAESEKDKEKIVAKARNKVIEDRYEEVYSQLDKDPVAYFEEFGEEHVKYMIDKGFLNIDKEELAKEVVRIDGWAHTLSRYDGNYEELPSGAVFFRE